MGECVSRWIHLPRKRFCLRRQSGRGRISTETPLALLRGKFNHSYNEHSPFMSKMIQWFFYECFLCDAWIILFSGIRTKRCRLVELGEVVIDKNGWSQWNLCHRKLTTVHGRSKKTTVNCQPRVTASANQKGLSCFVASDKCLLDFALSAPEILADKLITVRCENAYATL